MIKLLRHKKVLITAGPTREYWDPIRFITNGASGAMGLALADEAKRLGAQVTVVLGPSLALSTQSSVLSKGCRVVPVISAWDMYEAVKKHLPGQDIFIGAAAVVDYRPAAPLKRKFKRHLPSISLRLVGNPDIVAMVGHLRRGRPARPARCQARLRRKCGERSERLACRRPSCVVGFALETDHLLVNARQKLLNKRMDWIVANQVSNMGNVEGAAVLMSRWGDHSAFPRMPKDRLARRIWETILNG